MDSREKKRLETKRGQILNLLRSRGSEGITNVELSDVALRYGGHLGKLYELGYKIKKEPLGDGIFRYTLLSEPERERHERKPAIDILLDGVEKLGVSKSEFENLLNELGIAVRFKPYTYNKI